MKPYAEWAEVRECLPAQGEIFIAPDPQKRCGKDTWAVYQHWDPDTFKSVWDGQKYTTCPEIDIVCFGLFWNLEYAKKFAEVLEELLG